MAKRSNWYRVWARITLITVLLAALAPTISHALAAASDAKMSWMQICDGYSVKWVKVDSNGKPIVPSQAASHFDHCPFCLNHAGVIGILPGTKSLFKLAIVHEIFPKLYYHSHRPLFAWASAQPRAPPYQS
jgi:Protein of unknown function (DUF2946)